MTSSARINANRENARRSTGPKSDEGKRRSAANARRHGLAVTMDDLPQYRQEIDVLARGIAGPDASFERLKLAQTVAAATVDLWRIRRVRYESMKTMVENPVAWVNQTVPRFHFRQFRDEALAATVMAVRLARLSARKTPHKALKAELGTIDRIDRYERRALSRRMSAVRALDALVDDDTQG